MLLQMGPLGPVMTLVPSIAQNMFMPKNINSFYCYYHIGGHWENKNVHQKMTTRQSESNHASIYVLNGFYFCPKLPKNYNILPSEPLKIIIYNLMQGFLPQFIFQILLDWLLFLFLLEKVGGKTQSCFINKIHDNRQHLHIMRKSPWKALREKRYVSSIDCQKLSPKFWYLIVLVLHHSR